MKYLLTLLFCITVPFFSAIAEDKPTDSVEEFLVLKIKNGDLLSTSNGYLVSYFERDRAILRDVEPIVKRKGYDFLSVRTSYYYIEYQLYIENEGDAIIVSSEIIDKKRVFKFIKYSKAINGFQPTSFQEVCPEFEQIIGDASRTQEKLAEYRFSFHKDGLIQPGRKEPTLTWNGKHFVATEDLLNQTKSSVKRSLSTSKKKKK